MKRGDVQLCDLLIKMVGEDIVECPLLPYRRFVGELLRVLQPPLDSVAQLIDVCTHTGDIAETEASRNAAKAEALSVPI
eukprot:COSAG02_NODE_517_length_20800_cov_18.817497_13_plen_79_part_00